MNTTVLTSSRTAGRPHDVVRAAVSLVASMLVTLAGVQAISSYALPAPQGAVLAVDGPVQVSTVR